MIWAKLGQIAAGALIDFLFAFCVCFIIAVITVPLGLYSSSFQLGAFWVAFLASALRRLYQNWRR